MLSFSLNNNPKIYLFYSAFIFYNYLYKFNVYIEN